MKAKLVKCGLVAVMTMAVSLGMASCEKSYNKPAIETQAVTMAKDNAAYEAAVKEQLAAMQRGECKEMTLHLEQTDDSYILTSVLTRSNLNDNDRTGADSGYRD